MVTIQCTGREFDELASRVDQIMDQIMHRPFLGFRTSQIWQPTINLYETNNAYHICVDLAGVNTDEIDIKVENDILYITGQRETPAPKLTAGRTMKIHVLEIDHGQFYRAVKLPENVNTDDINAKYKKGLLWIELPKL